MCWAQGSAIVIFLAALQDVPRSLYDAAIVDGADRYQRFWHVTVPMCTPAIPSPNIRSGSSVPLWSAAMMPLAIDPDRRRYQALVGSGGIGSGVFLLAYAYA